MLHFLPAFLRGAIALLLYVINFIICGACVFALSPLRLLPIPSWQRYARKLYRAVPPLWTKISNFTCWLTSPTQWEIKIDPRVNSKESYILIANHRSWFDIIAVQKAISGLAPPPVYFMKRELLWIPILGWGCWLLDFPFMNRYSKEYLAKHPEKRGLDIEITRRACEHYRDLPVTLVNYLEGTRFTLHKQTLQQSPYKNLLKPRGGGVAFALQAMGEQVQHILNVTIVYYPDAYTMWELLCGKAQKIVVEVEVINIPQDFRGDYQNDEAYRQRFQTWLNQLWEEKDNKISAYKQLS